AHVEKGLKKHVEKESLDEKVLSEFLSHLHYQQGQYDQEQDYKALAKKLKQLHGKGGEYHLAFFATPSSTFEPIAKGLNFLRQTLDCEIELMLEKPFGQDRKSAGELFASITQHFDKKHLYLIDH